ncbi:hypothetical protein PCANC_16669 [Puccinia coronata f. sp. avenae]|uniref:Uncharacterized protein n=1 Tax=Puccinia coronata f. sp. avenae TaxID=200324 RepID=A0A2N5UEK0_9BASI|nr:hypothetical protein PCANC_16669 [Puccinia coronata f. sp. avenae]PLW45132.1 hypothetical protein PCASD_04557 [Puccinia coronata f. sp. avenae]
MNSFIFLLAILAPKSPFYSYEVLRSCVEEDGCVPKKLLPYRYERAPPKPPSGWQAQCFTIRPQTEGGTLLNHEVSNNILNFHNRSNRNLGIELVNKLKTWNFWFLKKEIEDTYHFDIPSGKEKSFRIRKLHPRFSSHRGSGSAR